MKAIVLKEITKKNLVEIMKLSDSLSKTQQRFVAPNSVSIAQAHYSDNAWFRGIYYKDRPVGFIMTGMFDGSVETKEVGDYLWRFMIAKEEQGKGFGYAAMVKWIEMAKEKGHKTLYLSVVPDEKGSAESFYEKFGFEKTGEIGGGEAIMRMSL